MSSVFDSPVRAKEFAARLILCAACIKAARSIQNIPTVIAAAVIANLIASTKSFNSLIAPLFPTAGQGLRDGIANILLRSSAVQKEYANHVNQHMIETRASTKKVWEKYGPVITRMPKEGMSEEKIMEIMNHISAVIEDGVIDEHISGNIYPYAYLKKTSKQSSQKSQNGSSNGVANGRHTVSENDELMESLDRLFTHAFHVSYLWNSLHEGEFGVGYWLNHQVIKIVADMFIGQNEAARDQVMGIVTTGGTDSLMNMVRLYKEWGRQNRDIDFGEGIIVAGENIHAAVTKGCELVGVKLLKVPCGADGCVDLKLLQEAITQAGSNLICVCVSTPSFGTGAVDDVRAAAKMAKNAGVGLHVDCCLGGFVINFIEEYRAQFLDVDGVTSISCDTHKNGWAPKGSSVLLTMPITDRFKGKVNLSFFSAYAIPDWDGGVYGSPGNPGSQHCSHVLQAYVCMLRMGRSGYAKVAKKITEACNGCVAVLKKDDRIQILAEHSQGRIGVNVFTFRIHPKMNWGVGASYALAHEMSKHKVIISAIKGDRVHYAVTPRSALDPNFVNKFQDAFKLGIAATEISAKQVLAGKMQFGGDAGLYGTLDAAMTPTSKNTKSVGEQVGNLLLGKRIAEDLVKAHFYALQDPSSNELF